MSGRSPELPAKAVVAVVECREYGDAAVQAALRRGVDLLGGIGRFVRPAERILLKPNILIGSPPQRHVTTHPSVLKAMGLLCREAGAEVRFGDSPGFGSGQSAAARCGLSAAAAEVGMAQADFSTAVQVRFNDALIAKQLFLARGALEADGIINLPKMKTHGFLRITGAVKNLFGCVPGIRKGEFHVKMPRAEHFAAMLVDIQRYLKPRLHVLDGIVAMEGNGPGSGAPRALNALLVSSDPAALDAIFCRLIHLPAAHVPTMKPAEDSGLGVCDERMIEIRGDDVSRLACPDFKAVRQPADPFDRSFPYYLKKWITPRPVIDASLCLNCGICVEVCPLEPKAVRRPGTDGASKPAYDYRRCIRCYCCQEMCPHGAVFIKRPVLSRLIHR